jgi:hypothetical protein
MRMVAALGVLCALTQTASAEIGDCNAIVDVAAKLACYNNEPPPAAARPAKPRHPVAARPPATAKPATSTGDSSTYVDRIGAEDAVVSAKMRSLCRGC